MSKASITVRTKDMSKNAIKKSMEQDLMNRSKTEKMLDARLEMEEKQHEERQRRKERRRRQRRRHAEGDEKSTEEVQSARLSRPETRQSQTSSGTTPKNDQSELSKRRKRINKLILKYSDRTTTDPKARKIRPKRRRRRASKQGHSNSGRIKKDRSRKDADMRLRAYKIARHSSGSKDPNHSNSLPQIMATANMLTLSKMRKDGSISVMDSNSTKRSDKPWVPPRMSATVVYKRAAAVIGLKTIQNDSEQLRSPSRGSLVRSRKGERKLREAVSLPAL